MCTPLNLHLACEGLQTARPRPNEEESFELLQQLSLCAGVARFFKSEQQGQGTPPECAG